MTRATSEELQKRRERAIAIINARPGITAQSLATHLGLSHTGISRAVNPTVGRLIDWLKSSEGIQVLEPDALHETVRLYPAGYQLPTKQLFQPSRGKSLTECRSYKVPLEDLHQFTQPTKPTQPATIARSIDTLRRSKPSTPAQQEITMPTRRTQEEIRAAIEDALTELMATGKPFTQHEVCRKAGAGTSTLHSFKDLKDRVNNAALTSRGIKKPPFESEGKPKSAPPIPSAEDSQSDMTMLCSSPKEIAIQQQFQELEQRNRELRQQLQAAQQQQSTPTAQDILALRLQGEINFWTEQIQQYRQQQQELEGAIAAAQAKVEVLSDLAEREQMQVHAASNGNGKVAIASGGAQ